MQCIGQTTIGKVGPVVYSVRVGPSYDSQQELGNMYVLHQTKQRRSLHPGFLVFGILTPLKRGKGWDDGRKGKRKEQGREQARRGEKLIG